MTGCFLFSFIQCRKKEKKNLCSSAPFTIYQLGIKEIINLNSYKLIFAVCVYKYIRWGISVSLFFNQSCRLVHSQVTCFFVFFIIFFMLYYSFREVN